MVQAAMISITGTQQLEGEEPESIQLVTEGSYCYEPGYIRFSYVETQMTGLEGVVTTFTIEDEKTVTLRRTGKVNSMMVFELGRIDDSLYEAGPGALMLRVQTKSLGVLMNEHGGIFDLSYSIEVEYATCGLNSYHIEIRVTRNAKCARLPAGALCICLYESFVVSRSSSMFAPAAASVESVCAASCETIKSCGAFVC